MFLSWDSVSKSDLISGAIFTFHVWNPALWSILDDVSGGVNLAESKLGIVE